MKYSKHFMALITALCVCMLFASTAFAAENSNISAKASNEKSNVDYLNYDFPDDAKIIYQSEDGVIYQTHESPEAISLQSARATQYNAAWVDKGKQATGNFSITNPHTLINTTEGTFKIESDYSKASAEMILVGGVSALADRTLSAADGDVRFSFKSNVTNLTVKYYVHNYSNVYGMRLMCWLW